MIYTTSTVPAVNYQRPMRTFILRDFLVYETHEVHKLLRVFWDSFVRPFRIVKLLQNSTLNALQLNTVRNGQILIYRCINIAIK